MAPVINMKMVEKAFELPLVTSAYTEMAKNVSPITPYVENSLTSITPMVEVGINTIKTKVEESVIPCLPDGMSAKIQTNMSTAVEHVTAVVEKIDTFACGGTFSVSWSMPPQAKVSIFSTTAVTCSTAVLMLVWIFADMPSGRQGITDSSTLVLMVLIPTSTMGVMVVNEFHIRGNGRHNLGHLCVGRGDKRELKSLFDHLHVHDRSHDLTGNSVNLDGSHCRW